MRGQAFQELDSNEPGGEAYLEPHLPTTGLISRGGSTTEDFSHCRTNVVRSRVRFAILPGDLAASQPQESDLSGIDQQSIYGLLTAMLLSPREMGVE